MSAVTIPTVIAIEKITTTSHQLNLVPTDLDHFHALKRGETFEQEPLDLLEIVDLLLELILPTADFSD